MPDIKFLTGNLKTLTKFTLIGMAIAIAVMFFSEYSFEGIGRDVEFNEISLDDSKEFTEQVKDSGSIQVSYSSAVNKAAPAVVNIFTTKTTTAPQAQVEDDPILRHFFGDRMPPVPRERAETSLGSGVIISTQGYILTNNHVIEKADEIQVALKDGRSAEAKVVGTDPESDLAVLKIKLNKLPSITLGHSSHLNVGDVVLAIGNPFGVGQTVTMGIVSATGRDRLGLHTFEDFIQTDAAINPGNSGGALVNALGNLIGINTAIFTRSGGSQGIGFAIPISYAKEITQQIIEKGHVVRGWLGVEIQDMTPALAESFGLKQPEGVIVAGVLKHGPADQAGLTPGDVILSIEGETVKDGKHAVKLISNAPPGTSIDVGILRGGEKLALKAETSQRPVPQ